MWTEANYNDELYHHGIKGQKWGRRRFQDENGKLTAAGRERYKSYKNDLKEFGKLNRHVAASQRHLKEEGVMLDRVKDAYDKSNRSYQKAMTSSSGLFGLKAATKATRVAKAQQAMDEAGGEYKKAAGAYGMAKKISSNDTRALVQKADYIVRKYGKGSVKDIEYETVKIGQNKLQKIMQGAPVTSILGRKRETETFVKTGTTLANMPIIGNIYTAKYVANEEYKLESNEIDRERSNPGAKRQLGGKNSAKYLSDNYFKGVSSVGAKDKKPKEASEKGPKAGNVGDKTESKTDINIKGPFGFKVKYNKHKTTEPVEIPNGQNNSGKKKNSGGSKKSKKKKRR